MKLPSWIAPSSKRAYSQPDDMSDGHFRRKNVDTFVGRPDRKIYNAPGHNSVQENAIIANNNNDVPILIVDGRQVGKISELGLLANEGNVPLEWLRIALGAKKAKAATEDLEPSQETRQNRGSSTA